MNATEVPAPPQAITANQHMDLLRREAFNELRAAGYDHCPDCYTVRTDGVCGWCRMQAILNADPDWRAMSDARTRLDFEPFVSFEASRVDEQIIAAFERKVDRAERDAKTPPNGCRHCGVTQRGHGQRWVPGIGRHVFTQPTDTQRLARMYARRAIRLGLPVWQRPGRQQTVQCPYCGNEVPGLLSGCDKAECRRREIAADAAFERAADR